MNILFKKIHSNACIPKYQTEGSSGFDFHACLDTDSVKLYAKTQAIISTGLSCVIPNGYEIQIRPRSGLAAKYGITIVNSPGTIDSFYRGIIMIILYNLGEQTFEIKNGDRIAQGVVQKIEQCELIEVSEFTEEDLKNDRGGGLGSTGI